MATDDGDDGSVPPLEHRAYFDIHVDEGYVSIDQSWGDRTLYTPAEARELADEIRAVADEAEAKFRTAQEPAGDNESGG